MFAKTIYACMFVQCTVCYKKCEPPKFITSLLHQVKTNFLSLARSAIYRVHSGLEKSLKVLEKSLNFYIHTKIYNAQHSQAHVARIRGVGSR